MHAHIGADVYMHAYMHASIITARMLTCMQIQAYMRSYT